MGPQTPSIGRIVHYKLNDRDSYPWPAIITIVDGPRLCLTVFTTTGELRVESTSQAPTFEEAKAGEWFWPPRA